MELTPSDAVPSSAGACCSLVAIADQLKASRKNTEVMQKKVCAATQQAQTGPAGLTGDFGHIGVPPLVR